MTRRDFWFGMAGALGALAPQAASADHNYRGWQYPRGRDPQEERRRLAVRERMLDLADRIDRAVREGDFSRGEAMRYFRRLDDVRDFLRDDRYLDVREFERRWDDLNEIGGDLRRRLVHRGGTNDRWARTDRWDRHDRYDRSNHHYDRSDRSDRYDRSGRYDRNDRYDDRDRRILDRNYRDRPERDRDYRR